MNQEKTNFTEQAVNKFIEFVLSRFIDAERLQVRIKSNLKQLKRGELDALTIQMSNFLMQPNLRIAEFQLDIGASAVNMQRVIHRKIELLHPSEGKLKIIISEEQLAAVLNSELTNSFSDKQDEIQFQQVSCDLRTEGAIAFHFNWLLAGKIKSGTCITSPKIESNSNEIVLIKQNVVGQEPPTDLVDYAIAKVTDILSLNDLGHRGTTFNIQQIQIAAGKVTVEADANIEQFPSG
ncbi:DUF2993 domain-containing protein [Phormidium sp. LEGE 05292]|uniref:LmeA family phospholipid-binding protein n=1 Tax=[Phormidium] sp. LEGE 05292 TaxID=767427 RepID=UPI001882EBB4|nr:DUF2993 domain-containing protein [Phormidium sp. LEGE 05292]MBE9229219.1 DUF2993 domain-containing protein [Phormidium sp. LEGE 05292]